MFAAMALSLLRIRARALLIGVAISMVACGGTPPPPKRGVLEKPVGSWKFRRYQQVQEVEVWVKNNPGVAHTASYVRASAEKRGRIGDGDLINAFVSRYQSDRGLLRASIVFARRLVQEGGYKIDEDKYDGVRVLTISGNDENWVLWPAKNHVIKLGGRYIDSVPRSLIGAYGKRYPSRLKSGMLDGPLPPEQPAATEPDDEAGEYDPDNPKPDWKEYDKGAVDKKIPDKNR